MRAYRWATGSVAALALSSLALGGWAKPADDSMPARIGPYGLVSFADAVRLCGADEGVRFVKCRPQKAILQAAIRRAAREHKRVLVSAGADWCVWCKVIDMYFNGWSDARLEPAAAGSRQDALALARYVAQTFVVVEIDAEAPDALKTLRSVGIGVEHLEEIPAVFVLTPHGARFVDMQMAELPKQGDFRGYRRPAILNLLRQAMAESGPVRR
jgi:hypothetical protein